MENTPQGVMQVLRNLQKVFPLPQSLQLGSTKVPVVYRCFIEDDTFVVSGFTMSSKPEVELTAIHPQAELYMPFGRRTWVAGNQFVFADYVSSGTGTKAYEKSNGLFSLFMAGQQPLAIESFHVNLNKPVMNMQFRCSHLEELADSLVKSPETSTVIRVVAPEVDDPVVSGISSLTGQ